MSAAEGYANYDALYEFVAFCQERGLSMRARRGDIRALVTSTSHRSQVHDECDLRLSLHSGDQQQVAIGEAEFSADAVPGGHSAEFNRWQYRNGDLSIEGDHPRHGEYTIVFRFLRPL